MAAPAWEVLLDGGWALFDPAAQQQLEREHAQGSAETVLDLGGRLYSVDFRRLRQTNIQTGFERHVRRGGGGAGAAPAATTQWEVSLEHGWQAFDAAAQQALDAAAATGADELELTLFGTEYTISLSQMRQRNKATGYYRAIRRGAPQPPVPFPPSPSLGSASPSPYHSGYGSDTDYGSDASLTPQADPFAPAPARAGVATRSGGRGGGRGGATVSTSTSTSTAGASSSTAPLPDLPELDCEPPSHLVCPITLELFQDPVMTCYGHTYEREAIMAHLDVQKVCPQTKQPLTKNQLYPNIQIRQAAEEFVEQHKVTPAALNAAASTTTSSSSSS